ncbi:acyl-CoA dehydrogenase [Acinetobacter baumannii]|uniref:Acyl-CoA dehydrogenase, N-terminal domain protein n=1 Tax=Acinetobacter baumannii 21072 TaxID=1310697 RepID=A0A062IEU7_ACIBA|nr:acyl-CoA dehydrogenase [Acinetobacter baumannii]KCY17072.1 acyl-CoA dehydrogenase, N-terminal domain protein [Acinetobacter baumannii 21072]MCW1509816.1 acyl-CoA dehydrogenase [Acinetobacter baumannii]MCW1514584.1 acyl-CoA dehydrogenase [Acinetobacter baumannii]MCW1519848.1 acyl-CoA dehydrogenase [Acinetobacter baumannii]MCZ2961664.1 acyl-CoA dehydrogenase [Acinetobacter baumannii]
MITLSNELLELQQKVREFIQQEVIPLESDPRQDSHGPSEALRQELVSRARHRGLLTPHASREMGGLGWSHLQKAVAFEEAGYSALGPIALNIHAPDEGNIHLLDVVANDAQKQKWLKKLVAGEIRSCFAMTEPAPGAGSDPSMLQTTAIADGDDYIINGRKWLITGADGASVAIIMAKMEDGSASMFLTDTNVEGFILEKNMNAMDSCFSGGHGILRFENLRIPKENVLGEIGKGFKYAQVRLAPARLTHCMRWLGQARRAHDIATQYARERQSFGKRLGDHQGVGFMLADNEMDILTTRLAVHYCAQVLDLGEKGNYESSLVKVISSEGIWRVVDRSVQILGGQAMTDESVVCKIFKDARGFRIYDGANEVHRMSIAKKLLGKQA